MTARFQKSKFSVLTMAIAATIGLSACGAPEIARDQVAMRVAAPAWMIERPITADPFVLTAFERMHQRNAAANIYIGGDGNAQSVEYGETADPTPVNPVALHLAAHDKSDNVAYIARPCQYSGMVDPEAECSQAYWEGKSFAPEVISAYNTALDKIRAHYDITGFNLIGYSGGGAIAAILAAQRSDVESLRTVAGNLDPAAKNMYHNFPIWNESLNPVDYINDLRDVPQIHFIGGQDETNPPAVLHSYLQAMGTSKCVDYKMIQEAEHERGWTNKWPGLLRENMPVCTAEPKVLEPLDLPEPIFYPRMTGDKK